MLKKALEQNSSLREMEALRNTERLHHLILDNTNDLIAIHRLADLKYEYVNPVTLKVLGYSQEELFSLSALELVHPDDMERVMNSIKEKLPKGAGNDEFRYRKKDGSYVWLEVTGNILPLEGDDTSLIIISRDITARKQMEAKVEQQLGTKEALRESENCYRTLFEKAPVAISINRNGRTLLANASYANLFGYESAAELIGTLVIDQVAPGCRRRIDDTIRQREQGRPLSPSHDTMGMRQDGSTFPVFVQANNIKLPDGPANVAFFADITARKQAEVALQRQVEAQSLLLEISKHLSNITTFNIDAFINLALRRIGEFDHNHRSYVFLFSEDGTTMINTHEWCAEGINPELENLQELPTSLYPWWMSKLRSRESIYIPSVADLPPEALAEKGILQTQDIQSLVIVPMIAEDKAIGFIGFDSVLTERDWSPENIVILESAAQIITKGLQRKIHAEALETSENYYRTIFENTGAATMIIEENMNIAMVNDECSRILNCGKEDLIGAKWTDFIPPKNVEFMKDNHKLRRTDPEAAPVQYEIQMMDKYGKCREGLLYADMIPGTKKSVATFVDLTDFKRIDRALKAISAVNAAMIHTQTEEELLKKVCEKIVAIGGYSLAWVGYLSAAPEQKVKPVSDAGRNNGYTNKLNIFLKDPKRSKGPTGTAIRTGKPVVCRNIKTDPNFSPWAKDALRRGFKSSMAIPLLENNRAFGALNIYSDEMGIFNGEEEKLLIGMANDLAFAIGFLRAQCRTGDCSGR